MDAQEYREEEAAQFSATKSWYWAWPCEELDQNDCEELKQILGSSDWEQRDPMIYQFSVNEYAMVDFSETMKKLVDEGTIAEFECVG